MDEPRMPPDPMTPMGQDAATLTEAWRSLVAAGMPPMVAAVFLATWIGTMGHQQPPEPT
jgi:hypothetical protein